MYHVCLTGLHAIHGAHYPHMADYAPGSSSPRGLDSSRGGSPAFSFGSPRIFSNHLEWDDEFRVAGTVEICEHCCRSCLSYQCSLSTYSCFSWYLAYLN